MKELRSSLVVTLATLTFALLANQFNALAQEGTSRPAATASDSSGDGSNLEEVAVAPGDIDSLIDNLSGESRRLSESECSPTVKWWSTRSR